MIKNSNESRLNETVFTITGLPRSTTKSALKAEARRPPTDELAHKRFKKDEVIVFSDKDPVHTVVPHQDPLVIRVIIANMMVHRIHVDSGALVSVIFRDCLDQLGIRGTRLTPTPLSLRSFVQKEVHPEGSIDLLVTVGDAPATSTQVVQFFVVKDPSSYNVIIGRDWLNAVKAIYSTYHITIKIPTKGGVAIIRGDQKQAK